MWLAIAQVLAWDDNEESDLRFEWDDQKAFENLAKHGVSFGEATEVFYDPNALEGKTPNTRLTRRGFLLLDIRPVVCYSPSSLNGMAM